MLEVAWCTEYVKIVMQIRDMGVTLCALTTLDTSEVIERAVEREKGSIGVVQWQSRAWWSRVWEKDVQCRWWWWMVDERRVVLWNAKASDWRQGFSEHQPTLQWGQAVRELGPLQLAGGKA